MCFVVFYFLSVHNVSILLNQGKESQANNHGGVHHVSKN